MHRKRLTIKACDRWFGGHPPSPSYGGETRLPLQARSGYWAAAMLFRDRGVRLGALQPDEEPFRSLILRYGGEDALRRIQQFRG